MTENLRLGDPTKEITLTPADSNVAENFVLPVAQTSGSQTWGYDEEHVFVRDTRAKGALYSYFTAIAGSQLDSEVTTPGYSICPKGWILPDHNAYYYLIHMKYDIEFIFVTGESAQTQEFNTAILKFPLSFVFTGTYRNIIAYPNSDSGYWTRTAVYNEDSTRVDAFYIQNTSTYKALIVGYGVRKEYGASIRCRV